MARVHSLRSPAARRCPGRPPPSLTRHREAVLAALQRAQSAEQVRSDADLEQVASTLVGAIYADHLAGRDLPPGWAGRVVDAVLGGAAGPALATGV